MNHKIVTQFDHVTVVLNTFLNVLIVHNTYTNVTTDETVLVSNNLIYNLRSKYWLYTLYVEVAGRDTPDTHSQQWKCLTTTYPTRSTVNILLCPFLEIYLLWVYLIL